METKKSLHRRRCLDQIVPRLTASDWQVILRAPESKAWETHDVWSLGQGDIAAVPQKHYREVTSHEPHLFLHFLSRTTPLLATKEPAVPQNPFVLPSHVTSCKLLATNQYISEAENGGRAALSFGRCLLIYHMWQANL